MWINQQVNRRLPSRRIVFFVFGSCVALELTRDAFSKFKKYRHLCVDTLEPAKHCKKITESLVEWIESRHRCGPHQVFQKFWLNQLSVWHNLATSNNEGERPFSNIFHSLDFAIRRTRRKTRERLHGVYDYFEDDRWCFVEPTNEESLASEEPWPTQNIYWSLPLLSWECSAQTYYPRHR